MPLFIADVVVVETAAGLDTFRRFPVFDDQAAFLLERDVVGSHDLTAWRMDFPIADPEIKLAVLGGRAWFDRSIDLFVLRIALQRFELGGRDQDRTDSRRFWI